MKKFTQAGRAAIHALFQEIKKDVPLQVHDSSNPKSKKCLKKGVNGCLSGSLTIEAALSLTLFLFFVILLAMPMELLNTQRQIQMALETEARKLSRQAWAVSAGLNGEESSVKQLFIQGTVILSLENRIRGIAGEEKLEELDCSGTRISPDGEWIELCADYKIRLPFSVFGLESVSMSSRSCKRGWIGREGGWFSGEEVSEEQVMVYVGRNSTRYHCSPDCHYLSNRLIPVSLEEAKKKRSESGAVYRPCSRCGSEASEGSVVFLFPNGENYHSRSDCTSLFYYIRQVPLSEVRDLGACSYCGGNG